MANPQLTVEIGAKIDGLRDSFNQAIREIDGLDKNTKGKLNSIDKAFEKLANEIDGSMKQIGNSTKNASNQISQNLAKAAQISANSGTAIKKGSDQAAFALTNLGRVAQDAPFGFIGIANNLNPLLESFQRLKAETGTTGGALKALGGSLMGAGGIGLALSAVTAIITFAQMGMRAWTGSVKDAKKAAEDYASTLETVRAVQLKGSQNAAKELTDLKILYSAYQNANLPLKSRKEAYAQLQDQYPNYFKNIAFEETATKRVTSAYNALTQAVLAEAQAQAARDKIVQNSTRLLENREKILDLEREQIKNQERLNKLQKQVNPNNASLTTVGVATNTSADFAATKAQVAINKNLQERRNLVTDSNILTSRNNDLLQFAATKQEQILDLTAKTRKEAEGTVRANSNILAPNAGQSLIGGAQDRLNNRPNPEAQLKASFKLPVGLTEYEKAILAAEESNNRFIDSIGQVGEAVLSSGISDAFSSIGEALSSGGNAIEGFGTAIISAFAGFLSQLGQMFIKQGVATVLMGKALALNPLTAAAAPGYIASGIGQIAAGALISVGGGLLSGVGRGSRSAGGQQGGNTPIRQFATGGYNLPAGMALVGERGPEIVDLPTGSSVFNNAKTGRMLGNGGTNITLGAGLRIDMGQLVVELDRERERMKR